MSWNPISVNPAAIRITNPIRDIVDKIQVTNPQKEVISLSIGDPTVFGNFTNPDSMNDELIKNIQTRKYNGYPHSCGYKEARDAIASKYTTTESPLTGSDVIVTSGCSHAIELAVTVLAEPGKNILIPAPGFSLYQTVCDYRGVQALPYRLLPEKSWEADLSHMESLIDDKTVAIFVNNPSNPCGSVYSEQHLRDILAVAEKHHLPIISDEIYGGLVFEGHTFHPLGKLSKNVPVLSVGGLAKEFMVPGWRLGWLIIHDRNGLLKEVAKGLVKLTQIILGPNSLIQSIVPFSLLHAEAEFQKTTIAQLYQNAQYLTDRLTSIKGLNPIKVGGTMYLMFGIDKTKFVDIEDDVAFASALRAEESVAVLPGTVFKCPNFIRLVITPPHHKLKEACDRIEEFCLRHQKQ